MGARNGQKFLIGLTQRESRNPQFDFLKPTHALFGYFTSLVDAYTKCLMPNKDEVEKLKKCMNDPREVFDKAMSRFAWDEQEEAQRESREEEEKAEKDQCNKLIGMTLSWSKPSSSLQRTITFLCQRHWTCPLERHKVHQYRSTGRLEPFSQKRKS